MTAKNPIKGNIIKDKFFLGIVITLSVISMIPLILILYYIFSHGIPFLSAKFFMLNSPSSMDISVYQTLEGAARAQAIGGVRNSLIGSFLIVGVGALMSIPFGVIVGLFLAENPYSKFGQVVQVAVDMIQGIPSIIFGIVLAIWMVKTAGIHAFAASVALALMMLPMVIKNTEETLKLVPNNIKEAAMGLGTPYWRMIAKIVLPSGLSGIITGVLVGLSRILGETAPLIFTAKMSNYISWNMSEKMYALPTLIYNESTKGTQNMIDNAWGASVVLIVLVLLLNIIMKVVSSKWKIKF